ncbi:MAG: DUF2461 domain-containing protein [Dermatophilaceae bacterium]
MTFHGIPARAFDFYAGLQADNSRAYWAAHKGVYDDCVKAPLSALLEELEPRFGAAKLFRPSRDVRFSADASPYKTQQGALVGDSTGVGYYVAVDAEGLVVGGGFHAHSREQTARLRSAVDSPDSGQRLEGIVADLLHGGFDQLGVRVKTAPRGYPTDHPRIDLLRYAELMFLKRFGTPAWVSTRRALPRIAGAWDSLGPLVSWLRTHVGDVS